MLEHITLSMDLIASLIVKIALQDTTVQILQGKQR